MKPEDQILQLARQQGLSVYFNARERASGKSWIKFSIRNGQCLAEFSNATDALAWFPGSQNLNDGRQLQSGSSTVAHSSI